MVGVAPSMQVAFEQSEELSVLRALEKNLLEGGYGTDQMVPILGDRFSIEENVVRVRIEILDCVQRFTKFPRIAFGLREIVVNQFAELHEICGHGGEAKVVIEVEARFIRSVDDR